MRRWRMLLGEASADELAASLSREEQQMDAALGALYDADDEESIDAPRRSKGLGSSAPRVARWLGDIRTYFPTSVVQVMQRDAIERLHLTSMLLEPELLDSIQPDVHLASSLVSLSHVMPDSTKRTARVVVGQVVAEIERRIANKTRAAVTGAVRRASRTRRPRRGGPHPRWPHVHDPRRRVARARARARSTGYPAELHAGRERGR